MFYLKSKCKAQPIVGLIIAKTWMTKRDCVTMVRGLTSRLSISVFSFSAINAIVLACNKMMIISRKWSQATEAEYFTDSKPAVIISLLFLRLATG